LQKKYVVSTIDSQLDGELVYDKLAIHGGGSRVTGRLFQEGATSALCLERASQGKDRPMDLRLRSKLKALPIRNPAAFSLRSAIATFVTISEQSATTAKTLEAALDKLSNAKLDEYSQPETIHSTSEAIAFLARRSAQSSEYLWKQRGNCLVLLSRGRFAESLGVPGVAFEFVIRTGRSTWTVYRIPDPGEMLDCAMYLERNELITHSRRPAKRPARRKQVRPRNKLAKLGRAIELALTPLPAPHRESSHQRRGSETVSISGALPS
jgi:hypothetical protein